MKFAHTEFMYLRAVLLTFVFLGLLQFFLKDTRQDSYSSRAASIKVPPTQSAQLKTSRPREARPAFRSEVMLQYGQRSFEEQEISIDSNMWGVLANFSIPVAGGFQMGARGEYMTGDNTYNGQYQSVNGIPGGKVSGPGTDEYYDLAALGQVDIFRSAISDAGFFTGLAYRAHTNKENFRGGYTREISALYLPLGLNNKFGLSQDWAIKAEGEFNYLVSGSTKSHMSEVGSEYTDVTHNQSSGYGFRISAKAQYQISKFGLLLGPYYSYWKVEDSDRVSTSYYGIERTMIEPANTTTSFGIHLGVFY